MDPGTKLTPAGIPLAMRDNLKDWMERLVYECRRCGYVLTPVVQSTYTCPVCAAHPTRPAVVVLTLVKEAIPTGWITGTTTVREIQNRVATTMTFPTFRIAGYRE